MIDILRVTNILNAAEGYVVLQNSRQTRSLPDSDMWIAADHKEMESIEHNKVIGWT